MLYLNETEKIVFIDWDWKEQPNSIELATAINHVSKFGEVKCAEMETGNDENALAIYPSIGIPFSQVKAYWDIRHEHYNQD